ncbi:MAG: hypothetical protein AAF762_08105 [Pseudomonadota bacterium]
MKRLFGTLAVVVTAMIVAAPTPVRANEDLAKIIAGIATIAIIAELADRERDREKKTASAVRQPERPTWHLQNNGARSPRWIEKDRSVRSLTRARSTRLPARCERLVQTPRGTRLVYGARCLEQRFTFSDRLPRRCEQLVQTTRGQRLAYGARCLRRDGWSVARR